MQRCSATQKFQFHKGSIKTRGEDQADQVRPRFNSIKVRLRHEFRTLLYHGEIEFQFHKGSIKTVLGGDISSYFMSSFNSIKVRLRPCAGVYVFSWESLFQFHKGSIKTNSDLVPGRVLHGFNSIKVRLRRT